MARETKKTKRETSTTDTVATAEQPVAIVVEAVTTISEDTKAS